MHTTPTPTSPAAYCIDMHGAIVAGYALRAAMRDPSPGIVATIAAPSARDGSRYVYACAVGNAVGMHASRRTPRGAANVAQTMVARIAGRAPQRGRVSAGMLAVVFVVAFVVASIDAGRTAVHAVQAAHATHAARMHAAECDAPLHACEGADACAAMVAGC